MGHSFKVSLEVIKSSRFKFSRKLSQGHATAVSCGSLGVINTDSERFVLYLVVLDFWV